MAKCHKCNGQISKYGIQHLKSGRFQRFQCKDCGAITAELIQSTPTPTIIAPNPAIIAHKPTKLKAPTEFLNIPEHGTTIKVQHLLDLISFIYLDGNITSSIFESNNNKLWADGIGTEDENGIIDNTLTYNITFPCHAKEPLVFDVSDLKHFTSRLALFDKKDIINLSVCGDRLTIFDTKKPNSKLIYTISDVMHIKTASTGLSIKFMDIIELKLINGELKFLKFDNKITIESNELKNFAKKAKILNTDYIPIAIKDNKFISKLVLESTESDLLDEYVHEFDCINIDAIKDTYAPYDNELLNIFNHGFGTATLKFNDNSPLHIEFKDNDIVANYLIAIHEF